VRSPYDDELCLALFAFDGDFNPLRLILHVKDLYGLAASEVNRLVDYVEVSEGGYFRLPLKRAIGLGKREIADWITWLDPRLEWKEDRRRVG
jgi:hypothetical protein